MGAGIELVSTENYHKYRGKCREMSEALVKEDPTLRLVRGHYACPFWGDQPHWWCEKEDGTIVDPTAKQFPMEGKAGEYIEFNGIITCEECGTQVPEEKAYIDGNHTFCTGNCFAEHVGLI